MESLSYDDVCRIVGDLYLNTRKKLESVDPGKISQLTADLQKSRQEIASLQAELERIKFAGSKDA